MNMNEEKIDKRSSKRVSAGYKAEILYGNNIYSGIIENLSASGVRVLTDPIESEVDFRSYDLTELKFKSPNGDDVTIECTIMWSSPIPPHNIRYRIGMELVGRPWDKISFFL